MIHFLQWSHTFYGLLHSNPTLMDPASYHTIWLGTEYHLPIGLDRVSYYPIKAEEPGINTKITMTP